MNDKKITSILGFVLGLTILVGWVALLTGTIVGLTSSEGESQWAAEAQAHQNREERDECVSWGMTTLCDEGRSDYECGVMQTDIINRCLTEKVEEGIIIPEVY